MALVRLSEKQIAARRANAAKSTGPRTAAGKAHSAQNGVKHGGYALLLNLPPQLATWAVDDARQRASEYSDPIERRLIAWCFFVQNHLKLFYALETRHHRRAFAENGYDRVKTIAALVSSGLWASLDRVHGRLYLRQTRAQRAVERYRRTRAQRVAGIYDVTRAHRMVETHNADRARGATEAQPSRPAQVNIGKANLQHADSTTPVFALPATPPAPLPPSSVSGIPFVIRAATVRERPAFQSATVSVPAACFDGHTPWSVPTPAADSRGGLFHSWRALTPLARCSLTARLPAPSGTPMLEARLRAQQ